jgi:hypothetical protein
MIPYQSPYGGGTSANHLWPQGPPAGFNPLQGGLGGFGQMPPQAANGLGMGGGTPPQMNPQMLAKIRARMGGNPMQGGMPQQPGQQMGMPQGVPFQQGGFQPPGQGMAQAPNQMFQTGVWDQGKADSDKAALDAFLADKGFSNIGDYYKSLPQRPPGSQIQPQGVPFQQGGFAPPGLQPGFNKPIAFEGFGARPKQPGLFAGQPFSQQPQAQMPPMNSQRGRGPFGGPQY